ncbi:MULTISPECIES: iron-sulfur cluster assembly scaffold protein [unclassified Sphingopyxis]|uniref:iron-sulfur cluster assembly scaffold protein n=1 Tax=unclassified Sphingopyxis TaxID=2614943 RepID=UPI00285A1E5F|nr:MULTISPECIES: iron-sulfur cluster assembly scaffold protein [unclassified Sphingopyxis]MDR6832619.1 NifU-like protein involved in Fe-S cluster formation [Sphingopyxis sp. BE122]MDR7228362.1 NifU-like protein involved in Fe-S cluster formation [Sphingopyxis sp. BE259]
MSAPLYNRDILALAVATAEHLPNPDARYHATARAPLCGSRILLDLDADDAGRVTGIGMHVEACALGQAAATLLARHVTGQGLGEIRGVRDAIAGWFGGTGDAPDWPGFDLLAPARDYPARQGAILLPFDAAILALEKQGARV